MIIQYRLKGFSLVELSIVLVILGLLVGGVLAGQSLIRAAELRSVNTDVRNFATAVNSFKDKYFMLPGDLNNATSFWTGGATANGNGDGFINYTGGASGEEYRSWQQLALASLIPGKYTGARSSVPPSKLNNGSFRLSYQTNVYGQSATFISLNKYGTSSNPANKAVLGPDEVTSLDIKLDDGAADKGWVMGFNEQGVPGCVTNDYTVGSGSYLTSSSAQRCKIFFKIN